MGIIFQAFMIIFMLLVSCSSAKKVPAFFTFGDSLVDVGNNNYIHTLAKANVFPHGIDLGKSTGRFSNGRTVIDIIQQDYLDFKKFTPPYLAPTTAGDVLLQGVNYASSGCGISNYTGALFGERINLDMQVGYHGKTVQAIISRIGSGAAKNLLRKAIYGVIVGSNDMMFKGLTSATMSEEDFLNFLISRLKLSLKKLYKWNARKFVVTNAALVGCIPFEKDYHLIYPQGSCVRTLNKMAHSYNQKLRGMLAELNKDLQGAIFIYADIYLVLQDLTQNYLSYGFENGVSACCSFAGQRGGLIPCNPFSRVCPDRSKYIFWDPFHLTDAAYVIAARYMMDGNSTIMSPMNLRQLLKLQ